MTFWINFWAILLAVATGGFALLAIVVAIGGAGDVRKLFASLREGQQHEHDDTKSGSKPQP